MKESRQFVDFHTVINAKGTAPISVHHDVELDCEDTAFFCALHALESIKAISYVLHQEELETFYQLIKENLPHGTY